MFVLCQLACAPVCEWYYEQLQCQRLSLMIQVFFVTVQYLHTYHLSYISISSLSICLLLLYCHNIQYLHTYHLSYISIYLSHLYPYVSYSYTVTLFSIYITYLCMYLSVSIRVLPVNKQQQQQHIRKQNTDHILMSFYYTFLILSHSLFTSLPIPSLPPLSPSTLSLPSLPPLSLSSPFE